MAYFVSVFSLHYIGNFCEQTAKNSDKSQKIWIVEFSNLVIVMGQEIESLRLRLKRFTIDEADEFYQIDSYMGLR